MRDSIMTVYNNKPQTIFLAIARKRAAMKAKGEAEKLKIKLKDHTITEMEHGTVLGLTWKSDLC